MENIEVDYQKYYYLRTVCQQYTRLEADDSPERLAFVIRLPAQLIHGIVWVRLDFSYLPQVPFAVAEDVNIYLVNIWSDWGHVMQTKVSLGRINEVNRFVAHFYKPGYIILTAVNS